MKFADVLHSVKGRHETENAVVKSVSISNGDHGCLTAWLFIEFHGGGCGFGGFKLGQADGDNLAKHGPNYCAEFIVRCLNTLGKDKWEDLPNTPLRCVHEGLGGGIIAIGHFLKDEWFCPRAEWPT